MAAISAKATPNGTSKSSGSGGANTHDDHDDHDSAALDFGISEPASSTSTPPVPNNTAPSNKKGPGKAGKKTLDPSEVNNLLNQKISQLETDKDAEEEEERAISRAVRIANKELSDLVASREDYAAKIDTLQTKCSDLLLQMKRVERDHAKAKKRADQLQKEKDQSRSEMQKAVSMKHKLETLCRELQKENKRIKDESKRFARDEQIRREELSERFESTIWEIKNRMIEEDDHQHNSSTGAGSRKSTIEADELFKTKFKSFVEQYEMRELHFQSLLRMKDVEVQFNLVRYEQQRKIAETESARAKSLHQQVSTFTQTEAELRSQLNIYVEKFKQVEDTLNNSNDLFLTFRKEMEDMSKKTKRLEKENAALSRKSETTARNLLEMAEERTRHQKELDNQKKKNAKLESICRALQEQRDTLKTRLRKCQGEQQELMDDEGEEEEGDEGDEEDEEGSDEYSGEDGSDDYDDDEDLEEESEDDLPEIEVPEEIVATQKSLQEELKKLNFPAAQQQQQQQQAPVRDGQQ